MAGVAALVGLATPAAADTIDPSSYAATVALGGSTTIRKTVVIEAGTPTSGVLDVVFLIDTSGSMGSVITAAKTAATDILSGLSAFGDLATGTGYYSEPGNDGTFTALTTNNAQQVADINSVNLLLGGGGGDFPEEGVAATYDAAANTAWRAGSNRFIIALGDATFKESDGVTVAQAQAALAAENVTFIGINFGNMTNTGFDGLDPTVFVTATGGSIFSSAISSSAIVDAIIATVGSSFSSYSSVTVDDLDAGLPGVGVSAVCVSADGASCSGSTATGSWTRAVDRTFEFDVTFTGLAEGTHSFSTHALVDAGIVASESDRITVGEGGPTPVPEPSLLSLLGIAIGGVASLRRFRRQAATA